MLKILQGPANNLSSQKLDNKKLSESYVWKYPSLICSFVEGLNLSKSDREIVRTRQNYDTKIENKPFYLCCISMILLPIWVFLFIIAIVYWTQKIYLLNTDYKISRFSEKTVEAVLIILPFFRPPFPISRQLSKMNELYNSLCIIWKRE